MPFFIQQLKRGFIEDYLCGNAMIALCNRQTGSCGASRKDGFVIQALVDAGPVEDVCEISKFLDERLCPNQSLMLAHDVELVEGVKQSVPSVIRPEIFDFGDLGLREPLFFFDVLCATEEVLPFVDGEVSFRTRLFAVAARERCGEKIQAATSAVYDSPHIGDNDILKRELLIRYEQFVAGLRIVLSDETIWASMMPFDETVLNDWDMGAAPVSSSLSVSDGAARASGIRGGDGAPLCKSGSMTTAKKSIT